MEDYRKNNAQNGNSQNGNSQCGKKMDPKFYGLLQHMIHSVIYHRHIPSALSCIKDIVHDVIIALMYGAKTQEGNTPKSCLDDIELKDGILSQLMILINYRITDSLRRENPHIGRKGSREKNNSAGTSPEITFFDYDSALDRSDIRDGLLDQQTPDRILFQKLLYEFIYRSILQYLDGISPKYKKIILLHLIGKEEISENDSTYLVEQSLALCGGEKGTMATPQKDLAKSFECSISYISQVIGPFKKRILSELKGYV